MIKNRKTIGLALGSGGFRGLAHIGVLKVLEKNGIKIDYLSGASIGALVAAYYATHGNAKKIEADLKHWPIDNLYKFFDFSWQGGFITGQKFSDFLKKEFEDDTFSKTKIPLQIIATNLIDGSPFVFSSGSVIKAIRASISVPLMFKPVEHQGKLLIDGGLSNPVPLRLLKNRGADILIGVNLYHKNEFVERNFNMPNVVLRSMRIALYNLAQADIKEADIVISPDTSEIISSQSLKKYNQETAKKLIKIGEVAARKALPKIKALLAE
jgi:NTE family protein